LSSFFSGSVTKFRVVSSKERNTVMRYRIFERLADQIATARKARGLRRTELAARIGRSPARLTEFERDMTSGRLSKDRLTLLVQICDALDLVPVICRPDEVRAKPRQDFPQEKLFGFNSTLNHHPCIYGYKLHKCKDQRVRPAGAVLRQASCLFALFHPEPCTFQDCSYKSADLNAVKRHTAASRTTAAGANRSRPPCPRV